MKKMVKYEVRNFVQQLPDSESGSFSELIEPLERICLGLGGYHVDSNLSSGGILSEIVGGKKEYVVGKINGAFALVSLQVDLQNRKRATRVINLEKYGHRQLLAAVAEFYSAKSGYNGRPELEVVEKG